MAPTPFTAPRRIAQAAAASPYAERGKPGTRIRVLVTDDSAVMRRLVSEAVQSDPSCEVVGTANNGRDALTKIEALRPDVVTLDIEMPVMNGLETLIPLRKAHPRLPVIMFSTLTERGAHATFEAMRRGASDYATKPSATNLADGRKAVVDELIPKIKALAGWREPTPAALRSIMRPATRPIPTPGRTAPAGSGASLASGGARGGRVDALVIGVSTGGPTALVTLWRDLPRSLPVPVLIVQHMPAAFTPQFAKQLDAVGTIPTVEAQAGMRVEPGRAYLAPGGHHMTVHHQGTGTVIGLNDDAPENSCRPAVDVLFRSSVAAYGSSILAVVLTGIGFDGLLGTRDVVAAGGHAIAQDQATSVVWGMPRAIAEAGLADAVLPIDQIGSAITARIRPRVPASAGRP
jgi:two-component system, chemotaxis family, protein-glutamate methylesterase/glutaminase